MTALLRIVSPGPLTRFLDPAGDDYLPCICGDTPTAIQCELYPLDTRCTQVLSATLAINGNAKAVTSATGNNPLVLAFNVGGDPTREVAGSWNEITITAQDNGTSGNFTTFVFYFYKTTGPSTNPTTTTTTTTTTPGPTRTAPPTTTTLMPPLTTPHPEKKKGKGKGKKGRS